MLYQTATRAQLGLAKLLSDVAEFVTNDGGDTLRLGQNVEQVFNFTHDLFVLGHDLVLFQAGEALQAHLQDFLRLRVRQAIQPIAAHPKGFFQSIRAVVIGVDHAAVGTGSGEHLAHQFAVPGAVHQLHLGHRWSGRLADDADEFVDIGHRHRQTLEHMAAFARLAQVEDGAACHHFAAVVEEDLNQVFQVAQLGLAVDERHHVDTKGVLQLGLLVQVVEHHLGHLAALELDNQPHAGFVGFILNVADALDFLLVHQFGHALLQRLLVHLVGQLVHDDGLALALVDVFKMALGTHHHLASTRAVAFLHAIDAVNDAGSGKVRRRDNLHQLFNGGLRIAQQVQAGVDDFVEVVRRNVGGHAHGDAARPIDQQIRNAGGQNQRFFFGAVVVGTEIHRFLFQVCQQLVRDLGQADFRVTHGGCAVAIDRAEIPLAIDQHVAHGKVLRHAHDGVVHGLVTVGVVLTNHVTDNTGRLLVGLVPVVVELMHREQYTTMHRLQAIAGIRQGTSHDYAHGVV